MNETPGLMNQTAGHPTKTGATADRVPTRIAVTWGLGALGTATMLNGVNVMLMFFLVNFIKIDPVVAGALLFSTKVLDAVTDPPMGLLSDRSYSRWGRRRPFLLAGAFFCSLSLIWLFNVPLFSKPAPVYLWICSGLVMYTLSYTVFTVPYMAMPTEMTDDYHERNRLMSWRTVFLTVGNLMGVGAAPVLVAMFGKDRDAYGQMALVMGLVIWLAMIGAFLGTAGARETARDDKPARIMEHIRLLRTNVPLLVLMGTKIVIYAGLAAFTAVVLFYFSSVLKRGPETLGVFFGTFSLAAIVCTPLQLLAGRRWDKRRVYVVCLGAYALGMLSWLAATPTETTLVLVLRAVWLGGFNAGLMLFGYSMLVDTYAWDFQMTKLRREGFLAATISFVEKFSLALGPLVIGALLSAMGFDKSLDPSADQSPSTVRAMEIGLVWIPVGTQLMAILLMRWYRLRKEDLQLAV
jgi:GPH family glycoside/pentoside/hexuronide:cation symporter